MLHKGTIGRLHSSGSQFSKSKHFLTKQSVIRVTPVVVVVVGPGSQWVLGCMGECGLCCAPSVCLLGESAGLDQGRALPRARGIVEM